MRSRSMPLLPLYSWHNNGDFLNYIDRETGVTWGVTGFNAGARFSSTDAQHQAHTLTGAAAPKPGEPVQIPVPDIGDPGPSSR